MDKVVGNLYRCTKGYSIDAIDEDGFRMEEDIEIKEGSVWEQDLDGVQMTDADIRLIGEDGTWIEIFIMELVYHFELIESEE